ncbi:alpha/beta hydrolase family protein [Mycobacterium xenopi 4042]|uniref:Alpha/beta hydrolase family protein n=1 Tax=Mycobacterium xenopi 4042 TaxID=1299334 RepID=X8ALF8_MYCXE|nr:alpha/beta hydrolase family protein [Mycobacterium xenopi 4042]
MQQLNAQGLHPVNDVVFYGSPGLELKDPAQLGLGSGHAYVMGAPTDPIVQGAAPLAPLHDWGPTPMKACSLNCPRKPASIRRASIVPGCMTTPTTRGFFTLRTDRIFCACPSTTSPPSSRAYPTTKC